MKVTLNLKRLNPGFSQEYANQHYGGKESEDNIRFTWEDEFDVPGDVKEFTVINRSSYTLSGEFPGGNKFSYSIPDVTIIQCDLPDGSHTQFPISGKLIQKTEKKMDKDGNIVFKVILKGGQEIVNPMDGAYFLKRDFPAELLPYVHEEEEEDEEEWEEDN